MRILFVTTEVYPLVKTGGLADVAGALSAALAEAGEDVRLILPAYPQAMRALLHWRPIGTGDVLGWRIHLMEGCMPDSGVPVLLVVCPLLFERPGNPYCASTGCDWPDNHERFAVLSRVAASVAVGEWGDQRSGWKGEEWKADVVHANDWQTGLVPAYLQQWEKTRARKGPASVFTIHNMAFQGLFPPYVMRRIGLPLDMFSVKGLEFYGDVSYLKSGLYYSHMLTTVSPTYAHEIQTDQAGHGMQGLLLARAKALVGILNGEDNRVWNPAADPSIHHPFTERQMSGKALDKMSLQRELGLHIRANAPLFGVISRLTEQKGVDLVLGAVSDIMVREGQLVILGAGDRPLEVACLTAAKSYPGKIAVRIGLDEALAHRIQAGSDVLLMPSRFEPCGLSQMYAMRYGTLPVVRRTGGLADTVVDVNDPDDRGTGFLFDAATVTAFLAVIHRAFDLYRNRAAWQSIQSRAMRQDFSWRRSAERYRQLYRKLVQKRHRGGTGSAVSVLGKENQEHAATE